MIFKIYIFRLKTKFFHNYSDMFSAGSVSAPSPSLFPVLLTLHNVVSQLSAVTVASTVLP